MNKQSNAPPRKDAAPGADKVTAQDYVMHLESNLESHYKRYKEGSYVAPLVRRVWIDKEDGSQRPIGIPAFEDKVLQRAIAMILSAIYEIDFYDFSNGFRESAVATMPLSRLGMVATKRK
jgi:RNA-directed DNA polymerase